MPAINLSTDGHPKARANNISPDNPFADLIPSQLIGNARSYGRELPPGFVLDPPVDQPPASVLPQGGMDWDVLIAKHGAKAGMQPQRSGGGELRQLSGHGAKACTETHSRRFCYLQN
jgi:hypothetical protein